MNWKNKGNLGQCERIERNHEMAKTYQNHLNCADAGSKADQENEQKAYSKLQEAEEDVSDAWAEWYQTRPGHPITWIHPKPLHDQAK
jgi:hypothetical protein